MKSSDVPTANDAMCIMFSVFKKLPEVLRIREDVGQIQVCPVCRQYGTCMSILKPHLPPLSTLTVVFQLIFDTVTSPGVVSALGWEKGHVNRLHHHCRWRAA